MTVKELMEILENYKEDEGGNDVSIFIRDGDGDLFALEESNLTIDSDNDIILNVEW